MPLRKLLAREITRLLGAGARCEFAAGTVKITLTENEASDLLRILEGTE